MKKYQKFLSENFQFLVIKFSIYLNRRVFVMFLGAEKILSRLPQIECLVRSGF